MIWGKDFEDRKAVIFFERGKTPQLYPRRPGMPHRAAGHQRADQLPGKGIGGAAL